MKHGYRKLSAGVLAGAVTTLLVAILQDFWPPIATTEVQGAITVLLTAAAWFMTPEVPRETPPETEAGV